MIRSTVQYMIYNSTTRLLLEDLVIQSFYHYFIIFYHNMQLWICVAPLFSLSHSEFPEFGSKRPTSHSFHSFSKIYEQIS